MSQRQHHGRESGHQLLHQLYQLRLNLVANLSQTCSIETPKDHLHMRFQKLEQPRRQPLLIRTTRHLQCINHRKYVGRRLALAQGHFRTIVAVRTLSLRRFPIAVLAAYISQIVQVQIVEEVLKSILLLDFMHLLLEN